jgi:hypothetical protein
LVIYIENPGTTWWPGLQMFEVTNNNCNTFLSKYSALPVNKIVYSFCNDLRKRKKKEIIFANSIK